MTWKEMARFAVFGSHLKLVGDLIDLLGRVSAETYSTSKASPTGSHQKASPKRY